MPRHYADSPRELPWPSWRGAVARAGQAVMETDFSLRCAGVAFYGLMSVFPAIALIVLVYGIGMDPASLSDHLETARPFVPSEVFKIVEERLEAVVTSSDEALSLGALVAVGMVFWSSSRGTASMMTLLGNAYMEPDGRGFARKAAVSVALTFGAIVFALVAVVVTATIPVAKSLLPFPAYAELIVQLISWIVLALFTFLAFVGLYRLAPNRRDATFVWIAPGAAASTVGWLIGSVAFSVYVENFGSYNATFGSLAAAIILMLWLYYSILIVAFGAAINAELELLTRMDSTTGPKMPMGERGAFVADHSIDELKS